MPDRSTSGLLRRGRLNETMSKGHKSANLRIRMQGLRRDILKLLVRGSQSAACPECQSEKLEQQISMFAVSSDATRQANIKGAGKRNLNAQRDKVVADREDADHHHH